MARRIRTAAKEPQILVRDWDRSGDLAELEETEKGLRESPPENSVLYDRRSGQS